MMSAKAGAAGLLAVFAIAAWALQPERALDMTATSSIAPVVARSDSFRLVSTWDDVGDEAGCSLVAGEAAGQGKRPLRLAPGCAADNPGLAAARYWLDRSDGTVAFAAADGRIVAEFAMADGAAFESYSPQQPVMTLLAE